MGENIPARDTMRRILKGGERSCVEDTVMVISIEEKSVVVDLEAKGLAADSLLRKKGCNGWRITKPIWITNWQPSKRRL
jgi:hypothetical protein